jgi:hypothetical protein
MPLMPLMPLMGLTGLTGLTGREQLARYRHLNSSFLRGARSQSAQDRMSCAVRGASACRARPLLDACGR